MNTSMLATTSVTFPTRGAFSSHFFLDMFVNPDESPSLCINVSIFTPGAYNDTVMTCVHPGLLSEYMSITDDIALKQPAFYVAVITFYTIIILMGTIANVGVVITIIKTTMRWNATTVYIINLAMADIFICTFDLPFSAYYQIGGQWVFGDTLCQFLPALFAMAVYDSALTLALIALDRFILVVYPFSSRLSLKFAIYSVIIVKFSSICAASPIAIFSKTKRVEHEFVPSAARTYCLEQWPSSHFRAIYNVATLLFQYCIPMLVIGCLYAAIFRRLRLRTNLHDKRFNLEKTNRILLAVVAVFAITWFPFHIFSLLSEFNYDLVKGRFYTVVDVMLRLLAMSSSCINPFLYGWFNENYRSSFMHMIQHQKRTKSNCESSNQRRASENYHRTSSLSSGRTKFTSVSYCDV